jgi:ribosomal protein S18 acetylase RimI-like enzyme
MVSPTSVDTRTATFNDRQKLAYLIHFEVHVHRHLDYHPPLDWVGERPFPILQKQGEIVAALACPPDPPNIAWIRMFACNNHFSVRRAWEVLWDSAYQELLESQEVAFAAAIPMQNWFRVLLKANRFEETHRVILLVWDGSDLPTENKQPDIIIRPTKFEDLEAIKSIDDASFVAVWQNSQAYLELAFRQAAIATLAEYDGKIVGYQISTATPMGGHLARLAVHPQMQKRGIGSALLRDVLQHFRQRGARTITVNTQDDNQASMRLYQKAGFEPTGEEYPIYQLKIERT